MITLRWNDKYIDFESLTWSGTDNQCSRELSFSIPWNPYDKDFEQISIQLGDIIYLHHDGNCIFIGTVTSRDKTAEIGSVSYTALDFMHYLLRSYATYKFTNTTPEKIAKKVCTDLEVRTGSLIATKYKIKKMLCENECVYDILAGAYRKAKAKTGKSYMPVMDGTSVSVIQKGLPSGVKIAQGVTITSATYSDTTDNMVNRVAIYNDKNKKLGKVEQKANVEKYGVYQQTFTKEKGVDAKSEAKALFVGVTKEASVDSIGDIRAVSGKSIVIADTATGLSGTFLITSDSHSFSNGNHTMSLELAWMSASGEVIEENTSGKKDLVDTAKCYYLSGSSVYHSSITCSACKGKKAKSSTVAKMKKIKITSGKNKGKRKYKPCAKCWQ